MRARMFLRKTSCAVNNITVQAELNKFKTKSKCHYAELTKLDVMDALVRGDETIITVLLMTCVGYGHDFAADFSSFKDYQHRPLTVKGSTAKDKETGRRSSSVESDS
ncbi:hypothetical protein PILCRDRAFT_810681 [Piloderma croceum F 1598]|uniref:DUF6697 domain-containing protein n=1 Tax=Piloderma croceum (strain F 1598) TaxID=765440 RepID=A0A0C3BXY3_PILCF|nr:hypothetical protein PILCRDRAFT_810681 [Piloderma croceum F 1598]